MRLFIVIFALIICICIFFGYLGGARNAADNYNKLLRPQQTINNN